MNTGLKITYVASESRLALLGVKKDWHILSINNHIIEDYLDFMFHSSAIRLSFQFSDSHGNLKKICYYKKDWEEEIGIEVEEMKIKRCGNKCIFCFVDQLPNGLRKELYVKDEDYRFSFLNGNYITGTNLTQNDLERISKLRLSPLYFSVHATEPVVRKQMIGYKKCELEILDIFKYLKRHNLNFHTQVVLCPSINDGEILKKTIFDLIKFYPSLESIAIVPLGKTSHRKGLFNLQNIDKEYARKFIKEIHKIEKEVSKIIDEKIIFLSDEFYLIADIEPPIYKRDDYIPQLENGVGMVREFYSEWKEAISHVPTKIKNPKKIGIITGILGEKVLMKIVDRLNLVKNLTVDILTVENELFGKSVTVSGLLSGQDIFNRINKIKNNYDIFLLPENCLRTNDNIFLDDISLKDLEHKIKKPILIVNNSVLELVNTIFSN